MGISAPEEMQRIAIFGGTFDPVHCAHLAVANAVYQALALDALYMIPCWQSPHRDKPTVAAEHRLAMLQAALGEQSPLQIDARELQRSGPSYSVETLRALRAEHPQAQLFLILGADAFQHFLHWHCWEEILQLVHLVVVQRPGHPLLDAQSDPALAALVDARRSNDLPKTRAGAIMSVEMPPSPISATEIRQLLQTGQVADNYLPTAVTQYIQQHGLYQ